MKQPLYGCLTQKAQLSYGLTEMLELTKTILKGGL